MIHNLKIQHFRCHRDITLSKLGKINLLTGMNNTGKSVALEALLLLSLAQSPLLAFERLRLLRGYSLSFSDHDLGNSLFYNWDVEENVLIASEEHFGDKATGKPNGWRSVKISAENQRKYLSSGQVRFDVDAIDEDSEVSGNDQDFRFILETPSKEVIENLAFGKNASDGVKLKGLYPVSVISSRRGISADQDAKRYSRLEIRRQQHEVVEPLKIIEPNLRSITVVAQDRGSTLYGDVGLEQLVPLSLMGDGIGRALSISLLMNSAKGGLVLIDEIENGFHYTVMVNIWRMIVKMAQDLDVQVFATTHSDECIRAAAEVMPETPERRSLLKLYRFDRTNTGTRVVDYSAHELAVAIDSEQEVR